VTGMTQETFLTASIGREEYAFPLACVHEIVPCTGLTRLPTAAEFVLGLTTLHGVAVPVVDLARRFAAVREQQTARSVVVVQMRLRQRPSLVGIVIDRLGRVTKVAREDVLPPPALDAVVAVEFLTGVFAGKEGLVLCLDVDRVLGADEKDALASLSDEAQAHRTAQPPVARVPYLCVRVAGQRCLLALGRLREIAPCGPITVVPGAPAFVLGATNVRGTVVPVADVATRYGLGGAAPTRGGQLLLVDVGDDPAPVGMVVDAVDGLFQVPVGAVDRTPPFGAPFPAEVIVGMAPIGDDFVPILDTERALAAANPEPAPSD
jgi:chemotaxis signal transduction protein